MFRQVSSAFLIRSCITLINEWSSDIKELLCSAWECMFHRLLQACETHQIPIYLTTVPVILPYHLPIPLKDLQPSIRNTLQYGIRGSAFVQNIIFGTWPAASCPWMHHTGDDVQHKSRTSSVILLLYSCTDSSSALSTAIREMICLFG